MIVYSCSTNHPQAKCLSLVPTGMRSSHGTGTSNNNMSGAAAAAVASVTPKGPASVAGSQRTEREQGSNDGPLLLLSCGGDGLIRVWHIAGLGKLICTLPGAQGKLEQVGARLRGSGCMS